MKMEIRKTRTGTLLRGTVLTTLLLVATGTMAGQESAMQNGEKREAAAQNSDKLHAAMEHSSIFTDPLSILWDNPALQPMRYTTSLTDVSAGARLATDYRGGSFSADTWLDSEKANITGYVGYDNGRYQKGIVYETDDVELTGPYLMYADGPGTLDKEIYRFGGSYIARLGRWGVGVEAGYQAGLSYRTVDPRPRNVSGLLHINPAASLMLGSRFLLGAGVSYSRYKQTNDLKFVSELGSNTVYHLTGLATTYGRFDGTGTSTYYTGHSWGAQAGILPVGSGFYVAADFSCMELTNVLEDFNNLPLAKTVTPTVSGVAGWKNHRWIIGATGSYERRRGTENIFGDAVSGQYPLIGSLTLYSRTVRSAGLTATMSQRHTVVGLDAAWHSRFEQHMSPMRQMEWQRLAVTMRAQQQIPLPRSGYIGIKGDITCSSPLSHSISGVTASSEELKGAVDAVNREYRLHTTTRLYGGIGAEALFPVKKRLMLGGTAEWRHTLEDVSGLSIGLKLSF